jgi:hypothetical protein
MQIKLIAIGLLIVAIGAAYLRYDYVVKDRDAAKAELSQTKGVLDTERQNAQEAANRSLAFRIEESNREKEHQKLVDCVAAGTCGIRVHHKACPAMPKAAADRPSTAGAAAEPDREFEQNYFNHRELINKYELREKALRVELAARSRPDYCQPKL